MIVTYLPPLMANVIRYN